MTNDEAAAIADMVRAAWPTMSDHQHMLLRRTLQDQNNSALVAKAVLHNLTHTWKRLPSTPEIIEAIRAERRNQQHPYQASDDPEPRVIPQWLRRWVAARNAQDMRVFPEQHPHGPPPNVELMPETEWVTEADSMDFETEWRKVMGQ